MMQYLNTRKLVRIWFTKDPNEFLPDINQRRMVRLREKNPEAQILLVINNDILYISEGKRLKDFCKKNNIIHYDFDFFSEKIKTPTDQKIYQMAQKEIDCSIEGKGGSLAAASDIARLLFLAEGFLYSDFDTRVEMFGLPDRYLLQNNTADFLLPAYYNDITAELSSFPIGNDIIAFLTDDHTVVYEIISEIISDIAYNYENAMSVLSQIKNFCFFSIFLDSKKYLTDIFSIRNAIINDYSIEDFLLSQNSMSISSLAENIRSNIKNYNGRILWSARFLTDLSVSNDELVRRWFLWEKNEFLKQSVLKFSGPDMWGAFLYKRIHRGSSIVTEEQIAEKLSCYSLATHGLSHCLYSPAGFNEFFKISQSDVNLHFEHLEQGPITDASWYLDDVKKFQFKEDLWVL